LILPFQPFGRLSEVLASADVLVTILEPEAGAFSVPSKVSTSLAAGRPILAAIPQANLAAKTIIRAKAGVVVAPRDRAGFVAAARSMAANAEMRAAWSQAARAYALAHFDIDVIVIQFEDALLDAVSHRSVQSLENWTASRS
jgi:glycosyltransferase involved in cell wall biosynthesis